MVLINSLNINELSDKIEVMVTTDTGVTITKVLVWNSSTYQDPAQAIDVSSLLTGATNVETFDIPADMLGVTNVLGLWFVEFTTSEVVEPEDCCQDNVRLGMVANFTKYHECILNKFLSSEIDNCDLTKYSLKNHCQECGSDPIYTSTLLDTLYFAVGSGFITEAISLIETLDEICEICHNCPDYGTTVLLTGGGYRVFDNILKQY